MGLLDTIPQIVGSALTGILPRGVYTAPSSGGSMVGGAWVGATAGATHECDCLVDDDVKDLVESMGGPRKMTHRRVLITQTSLAVTPETGGKVTARGETLTVLYRRQDPASATWELLAEV